MGFGFSILIKLGYNVLPGLTAIVDFLIRHYADDH